MMVSSPPPAGLQAGRERAASPWRQAWRAFMPARTRINSRERLRIVVGTLIGISLSSFLCHVLGGSMAAQFPWLIAPMGASAVLLFALPNGPMSQPWAVVGGNTVSALVGIAGVHGVHLLGFPEVAAGAAVATAIGVMLALRCLHPPGGATALLVVLSGIQQPAFAFYPVMLNSVLLVLAGIAYNHATGRTYPHLQQPRRDEGPVDATQADLDRVLANYNQVLDVSLDDLQSLLAQTRLRGYERKLADVRCSEVMSTDLVTVESGTSLQAAWALLRSRRVKALPVVDGTFRIAGIITQADFLRAADLNVHDGFDGKLRQLIRSTRSVYSDKPEVVGQIMTRSVQVAGMNRRLVDLLPVFGRTGHHHIPIIGEQERLVGMITQTDVVVALTRAASPRAPAQ